jgi:hypothetical protein
LVSDRYRHALLKKGAVGSTECTTNRAPNPMPLMRFIMTDITRKTVFLKTKYAKINEP